MTKEQYLQRKAELNAQLSALDEVYIENNKTYSIGQRLKLIEPSKETIAEVVNFRINWDGNIEPILRKVKKDGKVSDSKAYIWFHTKIEIL